MQKCQVVLRLFVPAHKQTTKAIHPGMAPFNDPPPSFEASFSLDRFGFFSSWPNMGGKAEFLQEVTHLVVAKPFVQAHSLRHLFAWPWTHHNEHLHGRTNHLL